MDIIYQTTISQIGNLAKQALLDQMIITFKQGAPDDIAEFCFCHTHSKTCGDLTVGDILTLRGVNYVITAVGDVATQNLRELGHITLRFDGAEQAEYPGSVHVQGVTPSEIEIGTQLIITRHKPREAQ